ncbi:MAG: DEAD/DEAH box helicase [Chloroflexi bacterium]|nr:DEAD/DEAH box helicase [Chloroflexota bacterium]
MHTAAFLKYLQTLPAYKGQMVHVDNIPPRRARCGKPKVDLHPALKKALEEAGVSSLYSHQTLGINALLSGKNVIVATGPASGKSLVYNVPVLDTILSDRRAKAFYLFPTKALAQDQLRALQKLTREIPEMGQVLTATFDGDTPYEERGEIRRSARIVLTNPDMLHLGILPNHRQWAGFLRGLRFVVLDEAHIYRGVFGSHVANVLRRLRRLCSHYGSEPLFVLCSATIANPQEHAESLTGLPSEVVNGDGSPYGGKDFVLWNPPVIDERRGTRRSANSEAAFLFSELVKKGVRTITFARTRRLVELIYLYTKGELRRGSGRLAERIRPYRAGYLPAERRKIEQALFKGELLGVSATNALELGIDVGDLDATVITGYPGSIASAWQQAGRSGRRGHRSLSFLIGVDNPLDQYFMRHPEAFFGRPLESALVSPGNPYVLKPHLLSAAYEWPLTQKDASLFQGDYEKATSELVEEGLLREREGRFYLSPSISYPAEGVNIRSTSQNSYSIVEGEKGVLLETVEPAVAFFQIHPGAIYIHQGESYLVTELNLTSRVAKVVPTDLPHYTQTMDTTDLRILEVLKEREIGSAKVYLGRVDVSTSVVGFKRKKQFTDEVISQEILDLPPNSFPTVALWFDIPEGTVQRLAGAGLDLAGGLHAAEHASIGLLPLFALCDRNDIGGVSTPVHPDTGKPQIFIYDGHPGGIGIAEKGYEVVERLLQYTLSLVTECPCEGGCPSCIQSPKCGNNNEPLDKAAAKVILEGLVGRRSILY